MHKSKVVKLFDGRNLGYSEFGDSNGTPLLYFHGWPTSRLQAQSYDDIANKLKIRIISIDRPGYGLSEFQENRTLLDWPDDILELANQLKINKFSIIGVSGGGPYAAVCAYKIPDKLKSAGIVVGLAPTYIKGLLEGTSNLSKFGWENYAKYPLLRKFSTLLHFFNAKYGPSLGLRRFMFGAKADKKILSDANVRKMVKNAYQEAFRNGYEGVELDLKLYTNDWGFNLKNIKSKVFLFYGEDDKNVSIKMGKYYAAQISNSKLIVYPNEGHLISKTHAEEILKTFIE